MNRTELLAGFGFAKPYTNISKIRGHCPLFLYICFDIPDIFEFRQRRTKKCLSRGMT